MTGIHTIERLTTNTNQETAIHIPMDDSGYLIRDTLTSEGISYCASTPSMRERRRFSDAARSDADAHDDTLVARDGTLQRLSTDA